MTIRKFNEYMNSKGTVVKPKVDATGDNVDVPKDRIAAPPKAEKNMKTTEEGGKVKKEMTSGHKPYVAKGHKTLEKWDNVNPDLKYQPDTKTENFLKATKDMSVSEFVKHVSDKYAISEEAWTKAPTISTPHGNFVPMPLEALAITRFLVLNNEHLMESFVRDLKRHDGLDALVKELLKHSEAYTEIADQMNADEAVSNKLVKSLRLSEMVSIPKHKAIPDDMNLGDDEEDEDEDDDMMGGGPDIDMDGPSDDEDEEGDDDMDMDMGDEDEEGMGPDDMGDEEDDNLDPSMGGGHGGPMAGGPMGDPRMKMKKKMGMHYLKKAMGIM